MWRGIQSFRGWEKKFGTVLTREAGRSASASREALYFCCWLFSCAVFELSRAFCECC